MQNFGEQLIFARKQKGMTQEQLARAMNVTRQGVSNWERNQSVPDLASIQRLANILEYEFLIPEDEKEAKPARGKAPEKELRLRISGKSAAMCVFSFIAGLLVMFLAMHISSPVTGEYIGSGINPNTINYFTQARSYRDNAAHIEITASENPCLLEVHDPYPDGLGWLYTFYFTETNGVDFYPETYTEYFFSDVDVCNTCVLSKDDLIIAWRGDKIPAHEQRTLRGGTPKDDSIGLGIKLAGKDARGNALEFFGYMPFSHEIKK